MDISKDIKKSDLFDTCLVIKKLPFQLKSKNRRTGNFQVFRAYQVPGQKIILNPVLRWLQENGCYFSTMIFLFILTLSFSPIIK